MNPFHGPSAFHEFDGEPIKQIGVGGQLALGSEVRLSGNDASTEQLAPPSVDGDSGDQRILGIDQPPSESQAVVRPTFPPTVQDLGHTGENLFLGRKVIASRHQSGLPALFHFHHYQSRRRRGFKVIVLHSFEILSQREDPRVSLFEIISQFLFLLGRAIRFGQ